MKLKATKAEMKLHLIEECRRVEEHLEKMKDKNGKVNVSTAIMSIQKIKADLRVWVVK